MLSVFLISGLLASVITVSSALVPISHQEHERQNLVGNAWIRRSAVNGSVRLPVRIALTQMNLDRGEKLLEEVSDPTSSKYGKYYSPEDIADLFAPSIQTINTVKEWLATEGFPEHRVNMTSNSQWIRLETTVAELETLLHTTFHHFKHIESGSFEIACEKYHLPRHIRQHIDFVTPGVLLPVPRMSRSSSSRKRSIVEASRRGARQTNMNKMPISDEELQAIPSNLRCGHTITPDCIKTLYNITDSYKSIPGNKLGIFENNDKFDQLDLNKFFSKFRPFVARVKVQNPFKSNLQDRDIPNGTHPKINSIDGGKAIATFGNSGVETLLDLMIAYPLLGAGDIIEYITDDGQDFYNGLGLNDFLDAIDGSYCNYTAFGYSNKPTHGVDEPFPDKRKGGYKGERQCGIHAPTNVISISYGWGEALLPMNYQRRQCNEWMKLALMGKTVVVSSGDYGVAAFHTSAGPQGCLGKNQDTIFQPQYPATCPYVLAVGATYLPEGADASSDMEEAATGFGSGGGFSNIYPIPSYQKSQVQGYFASHAPKYPYYKSTYNSSFHQNGGIYNRAGRGYPDVSAVGDNIFTFNRGNRSLAGGTSASAPLWASLLTRINAARLEAGMPTIGYVNPILYQNPQVFHDITKGYNPGCNTTGFSASKGWDPVTGLGTPNYPKLFELFMSTPTNKS